MLLKLNLLYFSWLKLVSAIFYEMFTFHQIVALQKLWKMFFISSKKLFSFSRCSNFCISTFPSFSSCQPMLERAWSKINLKVYDVIKCLNKDLITHFVWYFEKVKRYDSKTLVIDTALNKEYFYGKIILKLCTKS